MIWEDMEISTEIMRRRLIITDILILLCPLTVVAQAKFDFFNHMDLGVSIGVTGIGANVAMPVGDYVRVRTGFTYMPRFQMKSNFAVETSSLNVDRNMMRRMKDVMKNFTGVEPQENVDAIMQPTFEDFSFLVGLFPFRNNKHWNVTLGFFAGPSRIGKAVNSESGYPTLVAVNTYNTMYGKAVRGEELFVNPFDESGKQGTENATLPQELLNKMVETGMMGMPMGCFSDGDKAMMIPDANYVAKAEMKVNKFRPYLGLGYTAALSRDGRYSISVDAGIMLWGGHPSVYVDNVYKLKSIDEDEIYYYYDTVWQRKEDNDYEYVSSLRIDITRDVQDVKWKVGDMVRIVNHFKCFPMFSISFSRRLF